MPAGATAEPVEAPASTPPAEPASQTPAAQSAPPASPSPANAELPADAAAAGAAEGEQPKPETTPPTVNWREMLDKGEIDLEELSKHPRVAGKIGAVGRKLAPKIAEEELKGKWLAEYEAKQQEVRLNRLMEDDPDGYVAEVKRQRQELQQQSQAQGLVQKAYTEAGSALTEWLSQLPTEEREAVAARAPEGKTYGTSWTDGFKGWLDDAVQGLLDVRTKKAADEAVKKARSKWEKDELPARVKEALGTQMDSEETPDVNAGGVGDGALTLAGWKAMTPEQRRGLDKGQVDDMIRRESRAA